MTNLLSNAVKFTVRGTVTLSVSDDGDKIRILVNDTGCGMKKEFQEIIFQPFTQEDTTYGRTQTGTGLGMAIISELVQLLNGSISVQTVRVFQQIGFPYLFPRSPLISEGCGVSYKSTGNHPYIPSFMVTGIFHAPRQFSLTALSIPPGCIFHQGRKKYP